MCPLCMESVAFFSRFENRSQPKVNLQWALEMGGGGTENMSCHPEVSASSCLARWSQMFVENIPMYATSDIVFPHKLRSKSTG